MALTLTHPSWGRGRGATILCSVPRSPYFQYWWNAYHFLERSLCIHFCILLVQLLCVVDATLSRTRDFLSTCRLRYSHVMSYSQGYKGAILTRARSVSHSRLLSFPHIRQVCCLLYYYIRNTSHPCLVSPTKNLRRVPVLIAFIIPRPHTIAISSHTQNVPSPRTGNPAVAPRRETGEG